MLEICAIASGSNGNCYYIGNEQDAVLIDAGISCKQIVKRTEERGLNPAKIKAIFITHEHSDHLRGARVAAKRMRVPVYMTSRTYMAAYNNLKPDYPKFFNAGDEIEVGDFIIHSFTKNHDASEPCSFRVEYNGKNIGVFTDIGEPCENVTSHLKLCDALFLETNYDETMLREGRYPYHLKRRVASAQGHLSNIQALKLIENFAGNNLTHLLLSHISAENNTPEIAIDTFKAFQGKYNVQLTSRYEAGSVCCFE
ncbi:MAG TPA: MBL fold metallo-hydrolase [Prolixibacteraceae bacterium]|nr:MBL fold metallo-hydrolase [Prolixibacteraceae bacterium]